MNFDTKDYYIKNWIYSCIVYGLYVIENLIIKKLSIYTIYNKLEKLKKTVYKIIVLI